MERIDGVPLEWSPPQERRQELQALHCRLMVQLHALKGSVILPDSPLAGSRDPYAFIDDQLTNLSALLTRLEGPELPSLPDALAWLGSRRSQVPCRRLAVLHGDFHRNNILMRADGRAFVIDWSNVRLGDFRSDLAWIRLLTRADAQPDEGEAELGLYESLAGKEVSMIEYFEVAACTRLLTSTLLSLQFGAAGQGMRPGAEARLRRNPDLMTYFPLPPNGGLAPGTSARCDRSSRHRESRFLGCLALVGESGRACAPNLSQTPAENKS